MLRFMAGKPRPIGRAMTHPAFTWSAYMAYVWHSSRETAKYLQGLDRRGHLAPVLFYGSIDDLGSIGSVMAPVLSTGATIGDVL
jgi:hypothetical protein